MLLRRAAALLAEELQNTSQRFASFSFEVWIRQALLARLVEGPIKQPLCGKSNKADSIHLH